VELRHSEELRHGGGPVPEGFGVEYSESDFPGLKGQG
jgi:acetyl-CoA synthetase